MSIGDFIHNSSGYGQSIKLQREAARKYLISKGVDINQESLKQVCDAFYSTYAEIGVYAIHDGIIANPRYYNDASSVEIQNWALGKNFINDWISASEKESDEYNLDRYHAFIDNNDFKDALFEQFFTETVDPETNIKTFKANENSIFALSNVSTMSKSEIDYLKRRLQLGSISPISALTSAKESYTQAQSVARKIDPLLVDLDGDGIETTSIKNGIFFDHANDGFEEISAYQLVA